MNVLDPNTIQFEKGPSGCLNATYRGDTVYRNVRCVPLFPLSEKQGYVSVLKKSEKEYEELGIIKDISTFSDTQRDMVMEDVRFRYFVPEIMEIRKITRRSGREEWDIKTDSGDRVVVIRERKENVVLTETGIVFVTDADKCRYRISDYRALPVKSRVLVERMLL